MPIDLSSLAMTAGTSLLGGQIGQIFGIQNDQRQLKMNQQLLDQQTAANQQMSNYYQELQKQMWDYTNYENQVKHLENAGLNPALLYGKGGGGGATVGNGGMTVAPQSAPKGGMENIQMAGMALQNQATQASIDLMKAQSNKANAEAEATSGYQRDESVTRQQLNLSGITNTEAKTKLTNLQTEGQELANKLANGTLEQNISTANAYAQKVTAEMHIMNTQQWINENTAPTIVQQMQQTLNNSILQGYLTKAQTNLDNSKIAQIAQEITNSKEYVQIAQQNASTGRMNAVSNQQNADTSHEFMLLQKTLHDISDRENINYQLLEGAAKTMIGALIKWK